MDFRSAESCSVSRFPRTTRTARDSKKKAMRRAARGECHPLSIGTSLQHSIAESEGGDSGGAEGGPPAVRPAEVEPKEWALRCTTRRSLLRRVDGRHAREAHAELVGGGLEAAGAAGGAEREEDGAERAGSAPAAGRRWERACVATPCAARCWAACRGTWVASARAEKETTSAAGREVSGRGGASGGGGAREGPLLTKTGKGCACAAQGVLGGL